MADAHFALVLHAHLPFIHHPEHETFLEEDWLFEAITETYVPLLCLGTAREDGVPFRITMSLTPTLLEMLRTRSSGPLPAYLERRIELASKESARNADFPTERAVARIMLERSAQVGDFYAPLSTAT